MTRTNTHLSIARIDYSESEHGTLYINDIRFGDLDYQPVMADNGDEYQAFVHDHPMDEDFGMLQIRWDVLDSWANNPEINDQEDLACDWDKFVVYDESGVKIAKTI